MNLEKLEIIVLYLDGQITSVDRYLGPFEFGFNRTRHVLDTVPMVKKILTLKGITDFKMIDDYLEAITPELINEANNS